MERYRYARACVMALLAMAMLAAMPVAARPHRVEPGEIPVLAPNEGLALLAVDTDLDLAEVTVGRKGPSHLAATVGRMRAGTAFTLYVLPEGDYHWTRIDTAIETRVDLKDDAVLDFHVAPGRISYPGDLVFREEGTWAADIQVHDRALRAFDWLETAHPALPGRFPFLYAGLYADGFIDFYVAERAKAGRAARGFTAPAAPPSASTLPIAPRTLWRNDRIGRLALNAGGDLLAESIKLDDGRWAIDLLDLQAASATRLAVSEAPVRALRWASDRTLLGSVSNSGDVDVVTVFHIREAEGGRRRADAIRIGQEGKVVATLPDTPDHILFLTGGSLLIDLDISSRTSINAIGRSMSHPLNGDASHDVAWWPDGKGRLPMVTTVHDGRMRLEFRGADGKFAPVYESDGEHAMQPVAMSYDGSLLYALTDEGRPQRDLVVFDPLQKRITRTLFSHPGIDVERALFDDRGTPIGVTYYLEGRLVSEYFDAGDAKIAGLLAGAFPGRTASVVDRDRAGRQLIVEVEGSDAPPVLYHVDVEHRRASELEVERPSLQGVAMAPTRVLKATSADGFAIEAFLTLPPGAGPHPLVVIPHGGPIGVGDRLWFNPEVQFFASLGYAVLRVNFRGSEGYGRAFREAGYGAYGTRIEDDIDSALRVALGDGSIDARRVCIAGASYGGYSALMSAVRWPGRFRCAISISGVSDRLLQFNASDSAQTASGRKLMEEMMGHPRSEAAALRDVSPVYRYADLSTPVLLIHGDDDMRVDFEQSRRMERMLDVAGRRAPMLVVRRGGHSLSSLDQIDQTYRAVAAFLHSHLDGPATAGGEPGPGAAKPSVAAVAPPSRADH